MRTIKQPKKRKNGLTRHQQMVKDGTWPGHLQAMIAGSKRTREENKKAAEEKEILAKRVKELEEELEKRL